MAARLARQDVERVFSDGETFDDLRGASILLTGGTGFVGAWLLETFAYLNDQHNLNCTVYIPTRNLQGFSTKALHLARRTEFVFIPGDVRSFQMPDVPINFVIHAAAPYIYNVDPLDVVDTIVSGTRHVLNIAAEKSVKRLLYVSSGAIYGKQDPACAHMPETYQGPIDLSAPSSAYAESKRLAELLCAIYQEQAGVVGSIARLFTVIGPYQSLDSGFALTDFIRDGLQGKPITLNSDGSAIRSYLYGADIARWLLTILLRGQVGAAYNVGSDVPVTVLSIAHKIRNLLQEQGIETTVQAKNNGTNAPPNRYVPDISRVKNELGLAPQFDLDSALAHTVNWHIKLNLGRKSFT
jgi:nucleoside-diphosphate-sugar epimerase